MIIHQTYPIHRQYPAHTQRPVIVCSPLVRSQAIKDTRTMQIRITRVVWTKHTIFVMTLLCNIGNFNNQCPIPVT